MQLFEECADNGWASVDRLTSFIRSVLPGSAPSVHSEDVYDSDENVRSKLFISH